MHTTSADHGLHTPISRRSVAKGLAWATPVVLSSSVLPAMAASPVLSLTYLGSCKYPGNSDGDPLCKQGYRLQTRWINSSNQTLRTTFTVNLSMSNTSAQDVQYLYFNGVYYAYTGNANYVITLDVPPGTYNIDAITEGVSSANLSGSVTGTAHYCYNAVPYTFSLDHTFDTTPPDCEVACPGGINVATPPNLSPPPC